MLPRRPLHNIYLWIIPPQAILVRQIQTRHRSRELEIIIFWANTAGFGRVWGFLRGYKDLITLFSQEHPSSAFWMSSLSRMKRGMSFFFWPLTKMSPLPRLQYLTMPLTKGIYRFFVGKTLNPNWCREYRVYIIDLYG